MDLDPFHESRSIDHHPFRSACYAPFTALSFDVHGTVSVCSFTRSTPLGRVGEQPLLDLWQGSAALSLRNAVRSDDLDSFCQRCAEEIAGGNLHSALAVGFDQFTIDGAGWPTRMEFALSNECNLQCVMCNGEYSSAIRNRREGLPELPDRYGAEFMAELEDFLPHLEQARFLGGEPFLADINFAIWESMIEQGLSVECNVTTNGTQWNDRIQRVLDALPFSVGVSIDGMLSETVEHVRAGASHQRIRDNLERLFDYRNRTGASISLTFCLMNETWSELGDYLLFAERHRCRVYVNTVRQPPRHSLYALPPDRLRPIVDTLEAQRDGVAARLEINRAVWVEQIGRLSDHLERSEGEWSTMTDRHGAPTARWETLVETVVNAAEGEADLLDAVQSIADGHVSVLRGDENDLLQFGSDYLGVDVRAAHGRPVAAVHPLVAEVLGHDIEVLAERSQRGRVVRIVTMQAPSRPQTVVLSVIAAGTSPHGTVRIGTLLGTTEGVSVGLPQRVDSSGD